MRSTLASVGAAIILLSLPMDLFFQQIISYPSTLVLDSSANATISRTINYDVLLGRYFVNGSEKIPVDTAMDAFVLPYWQGDGISPGVLFDCPTGNCTYDPFHTVAMDYQCKEMPKSFVEFGCQPTTSAEWTTTVDYYLLNTKGQPMPNISTCGYYLDIPNHGKQLMSGYEVKADGSIGQILSTRFLPWMDLASSVLYWNGSLSFPDVKLPVMDFFVASTPGGFDGTLKNNTPIVTECEVHWVVQKLNATVNAGVLIEDTLETLLLESDVDEAWGGENGQDYVASYSKTVHDPYSFAADKQSTFRVTNDTAYKMFLLWTELAPSSFVLSSPTDPAEGSSVFKWFWIASPPRLIEGSKNNPWQAPHNVSQHMENLMTTLNQVLRRNPTSKSFRTDVAIGKAFKYVVLVRIAWKWLSLPLILLVFSLLFLMATVIRSTRDQENIGIFKTSALAILFNGLGEDVQQRVGSNVNRMGYARDRARDMKVQLDDE